MAHIYSTYTLSHRSLEETVALMGRTPSAAPDHSETRLDSTKSLNAQPRTVKDKHTGMGGKREAKLVVRSSSKERLSTSGRMQSNDRNQDQSYDRSSEEAAHQAKEPIDKKHQSQQSKNGMHQAKESQESQLRSKESKTSYQSEESIYCEASPTIAQSFHSLTSDAAPD
ncbi:hypothetical protein SARC_15132 [Sphaeroforma arctica JP610]|uniref:Uncharacterized protein n=1 Tax=Sphaeroforma arctica JP610 TaxID=667725 RepID=A0A0L0F6Q6_9EUKA|nr:hypothetical protein SARC_15132 [Sphaeroforma arctica JP610]KNC72314.1 hypothetical protein SARC_15132 [Sphaeroforma arctica JP610]|eukprot:XP_014146216.1 hypothetical protein SARC_15132 [Sphaeroforma arctica JP610]